MAACIKTSGCCEIAAECNFFKALGFDYYFIRDGNNLNELIDIFAELKDVDHPVVVHICTVKGKGYHFAEAGKEDWHYMGPFDMATGKQLHESGHFETYESLTGDYLARKMKEDPAVIAITAGTPKILGFDGDLRKQYPRRRIGQ